MLEQTHNRDVLEKLFSQTLSIKLHTVWEKYQKF